MSKQAQTYKLVKKKLNAITTFSIVTPMAEKKAGNKDTR